MRDYISDSDFSAHVSVSAGKGFSEVEVQAMIAYLEESKKTVVWDIGEGGSVSAQPVFHGNKLFFGACDRNFYCLDVNTGEEIWSFKTEAPNPTGPDIEGEKIYFPSYDRNLYALDIEGNLLWKKYLGDKCASPLAYKSKIYIGCKNGKFYCISQDGEIEWEFKARDSIPTKPVICSDLIIFGCFDRNIYAVDFNGQLKWKFPTKSQIIDMGAVWDDTVYMGSYDGILYAIGKDGNLMWKFNSKEPIDTVPFVNGNGIYFITHMGTLYALDFQGRERWNFKTNAFPGIGAVALEGKVFFPSCNNNVYALDESSGKLLWKLSCSGPMISIPGVYNENLMIGSWDCHMYSISMEGKVNWKFNTSLSFMSPVGAEETDVPTKSFEVTWEQASKESKKPKEEEASIADYGEFSGTYIDTSKSDYLGHSKKGYVKKGDF